MIDADYIDDPALLTNTPFKTESLLHSLEQTAVGIGHDVNANKREFMNFEEGSIYLHFKWQASVISRLVHIPQQENLKGQHQHRDMIWTIINRFSIKWKSDLADEIK